MSEADVRIGPLTSADVASAVELAVRVLRMKPGDRGEQFAADVSPHLGYPASDRESPYSTELSGTQRARGRARRIGPPGKETLRRASAPCCLQRSETLLYVSELANANNQLSLRLHA